MARGDELHLGGATLAAIRCSVGTRARRLVLAITLLVGVLGAVALAAGPPAGRTFVALSNSTQSLMSVTVPLFGILLARDLKGVRGAASVAPVFTAAILLAAAIGLVGVLVCAATLAVAASDAAPDAWSHFGTVVVGSLLVQVLAVLVGTALGLLLPSAVAAFVASIVVPLGLWLVLGGVDVLHPARAWLTPYAAARNLLSGRMSAAAWVQWLAVALMWGVGLNAVGVIRLKR